MKFGNEMWPTGDEWRSWPNVRPGIETGPAPATARPEANAESNNECWGSSPKYSSGHSRFQTRSLEVEPWPLYAVARNRPRCPLLAQSRHRLLHRTRPLSG